MQPNNSQEALAQLQGQQATAQNPNDILNAQRQQLGVNNAQDTVTGLRGQINNTTKLLQQVAPSVMGRTQSSLVTNAQASKQIQNEQAPLSQNLTNEGTQYNQANEDLNRLQGEASTAASGIYQGQQDKLSYLQNLYTSLYGREQDAEAARVAELNRQEQIRQFNTSEANKLKTSSSGGISSLLGGLTGGKTSGTNVPTTAPATGAAQQEAYDDVYTRISNQSDAELRSDYEATMRGYKAGIPKDQYKLLLYAQLRPDLFGTAPAGTLIKGASY